MNMDWIHWTYLGLILALCIMLGMAQSDLSDTQDILEQCSYALGALNDASTILIDMYNELQCEAHNGQR